MIERREFLKKIALVAGVMGGGSLLPASGKTAEQEIGIAVVEGTNPAGQAREAIRFLGGMQRFVRRETGLSSFRTPREPGGGHHQPGYGG